MSRRSRRLRLPPGRADGTGTAPNPTGDDRCDSC
jgi:hypothetical protein